VHCYVNSPRRSWLDGKINLSEEQGINPRIWTDTKFLDEEIARDPLLPGKMAEISKKSRPMMASTPKSYSEYTWQILNMSPEKVQKYNDRAGFRVQSSTDFKPWQAMDWVQMIVDANAKGLLVHGYTKETDLLDLIKDTGIKMNMSLAAKGDTPGQITMDLNNGMDWATARKYQEESDDLGIIFNAANQAQLEWALDQPWIQYIIPYHSSGQKGTQFAKFGAEDFTKVQSPAYKDGRRKLNKAGKSVPDIPKVYRKEHGNDPAQMKAYNEAHGIEPQFKQYEDHPGHMKLVVDYARTDTPHNVPDPDKINWDKADQLMKDYVDLGGKNKDITPDMVDELTQRIKGMRKGKPNDYDDLSGRLDKLIATKKS
jgi:hypothetical protein